jgi:hypothetical protein
VPDWLKGAASAKPDQRNLIKRLLLDEWLLRPPRPNRTAWFLFLMGLMGLVFAGASLLMFPHRPVYDTRAESLAAFLSLICTYGAELLPQHLRGRVAAARMIGLIAGILMLILFVLWGIKINRWAI